MTEPGAPVEDGPCLSIQAGKCITKPAKDKDAFSGIVVCACGAGERETVRNGDGVSGRAGAGESGPLVCNIGKESTFAIMDIYFVGKSGASADATVGLTDL